MPTLRLHREALRNSLPVGYVEQQRLREVHSLMAVVISASFAAISYAFRFIAAAKGAFLHQARGL
ncbi:hypothetical protein V4C53_02195 [Paraburkholderia azotifigens]|uniref:hypothetical protein n=1 Tax=Paraburkholderia azotifigens TaxID=2057004 RepID=UPI003175EF11